MPLNKLDQMIDEESEQEVVEQRSGILFKTLDGLEICVNHRHKLGSGFKKLLRWDTCMYEKHTVGSRKFKNSSAKKSVTFEMACQALRILGVIIPYGLPACKNCISDIKDLVENADDPMSTDITQSQQSTHSYIGREDFPPEYEEMDDMEDEDYQPSQNRADRVGDFFD